MIHKDWRVALAITAQISGICFGTSAAVRGQEDSVAEPGIVSAPIAARPVLVSPELIRKGQVQAYYDPAKLASPPIMSAPSLILMDAMTGQVIYEQNADVRREPASTTKILTGLIFAENTRPDEVVVCRDPRIEDWDESKMHLVPGEKLSAEDLLRATLIRSANDGAALMAEHISGKLSNFAGRMNARAKELGAVNSHFVTPNGLHDANHYSTARDIALIARAAMQNDRFAAAVRDTQCTIQRSVRKNNTLFIAKVARKFHEKVAGADGVKSGYTRQARFCYVGSATREGRRLLSVVLGSENSSADSAALINWGFDRFPAQYVARKSDVVAQATIRDGDRPSVPVLAARDLHVTTDSVNNDARFAVTSEVRLYPNLVAPIRKGQQLGFLMAFAGGKPVGKTPLLASDEVRFSETAAAIRLLNTIFPYIIGGLTAVGGYYLYRNHYAATLTKNNRRRRTYLATQGGRMDRGR